MKTSRIPYTYKIRWETGVFYYGCRFAKNCNPNDFWVTYKTSSKYVKEYIEQHGEPSSVRVTRTFKTPEEALRWESKLLSKVSANRNPKMLNRSVGMSDKHNYKDGFGTKEIHDKVDMTLRTKYGSRGSGSDVIKSNVMATNTARYGTYHTLSTKSVKSARESACLKKYGNVNPFASKKFYENRINPMFVLRHKQKHAEVMKNLDYTVAIELRKKHYQATMGVDSLFQTKEFIETQKKRNIELYGVDNYAKTPEFKQKIESMKCSCPYGCKSNHRYDRGNFAIHMKKSHDWSTQQIREFHEKNKIN